MAGWAALITAIAALIGALVWPMAIVTALMIFRDPIREASRNLPALLGRMQKVKLGAFEAELSAKTAGLVEEAIDAPGEISFSQIRSAASVKLAARGIGDAALHDQLEKLCLEYETIRKAMPSGQARTRAMVEVLVKLRTLAPTVEHFLAELKASSSAGKRLAAVAIMQVDPGLADLPWIVDRFRQDDPFLFFQAGTILRSVANLHAGTDPAVVAAANEALAIIRAFAGTPDANTITLLESIASGAAA
ncbi:hypothetical protein [Sphingomonas sp.]|uniref:hypothetical protein n=1 Tax=Sphingomonas sp. TaxID=28214 RepID=UPI000DB24FA6|nr:hypothetical protein [Sphingomonas sp.]PZU08558.1 MAG: hypothetical protein DI605_11350 [Sphingomonas sp.]